MTWVRRAATPPPPHECSPPAQAGGVWFDTKPDGSHGDLWRCDRCGLLWTIRDAFNTNGPEWRRAGWWTNWQHRHAGREGMQDAKLRLGGFGYTRGGLAWPIWVVLISLLGGLIVWWAL